MKIAVCVLFAFLALGVLVAVAEENKPKDIFSYADDPVISVSKWLNEKGFIVVLKDQWDSMNKELFKCREERSHMEWNPTLKIVDGPSNLTFPRYKINDLIPRQ